MRVVSQQHTSNKRLFDQLLMGADNCQSSSDDHNEGGSSSNNAIENLRLLEEDDNESESE